MSRVIAPLSKNKARLFRVQILARHVSRPLHALYSPPIHFPGYLRGTMVDDDAEGLLSPPS